MLRTFSESLGLLPAYQDCFLSPAQVVSPLCEDRIALFTETSFFKHYNIFWDKSVHCVFEHLGMISVTHWFYSAFPYYNFNLFLKICPKRHCETCFLSHCSLLWHFLYKLNRGDPMDGHDSIKGWLEVKTITFSQFVVKCIFILNITFIILNYF